jgi:hypothetical protein
MRWRGLLLAALLAASAPAAVAADPEVMAFTRDLEARFKAANPDLPVAISGPLTLAIGPNGAKGAVNLDRIYNFCLNNAAIACAATKADFVDNLSKSFAAQTDPAATIVRRENLRLLVREAGYCTEIERAMRTAKTPSEPLTAAFTPDTCLIVMFDAPTSRRVAHLDDMTALGLGRDAAWQLAREQVLAPLPKLAALSVEPNSLNLFTDMPDITSLVLDNKGWAALAARYPGKRIIVTMPDDMALTLMVAPPDTDLADLRRVTQQFFREAQRGISPSLLEWTGTGWEIVP